MVRSNLAAEQQQPPRPRGAWSKVGVGEQKSRRASSSSVSAANSPAVDTERYSKVLLKAGNGDADIADIALQQLMDREVQDS